MHGRCIVGLQVAGGKRAVVEPMHEHIAALIVGWYYAGEVEVGRTLFCARRLLVKPGVVGFAPFAVGVPGGLVAFARSESRRHQYRAGE